MKKIRKMMVALITLALVLFAMPAMAECQDGYNFAGESTFILTDAGRIVGIKEAYENVEKLYDYQVSAVSSPVGVESDGRIVRYKAMSKVALDGIEIYKGGTSLNVKINIYADKLDLVKQIVADRNGYDFEFELSANNIIRATYYLQQLCEYNSMGAHVFFTSQSCKEIVGTVTFYNGTWAYLYAGRLAGSCETYLGFAAGVPANNDGGNESQHEEAHGSASVTVTVEEHTEMTYDKTVTIVIEGEFDYQKVIEGITSGCGTTESNSCK